MKMARIVSFKRVGRDKRSLKGIFLWKLIREGEINSYVVEEKIARRLRGSGGSGGSEMIHRTRVIFVEYSLPGDQPEVCKSFWTLRLNDCWLKLGQ